MYKVGDRFRIVEERLVHYKNLRGVVFSIIAIDDEDPYTITIDTPENHHWKWGFVSQKHLLEFWEPVPNQLTVIFDV